MFGLHVWFCGLLSQPILVSKLNVWFMSAVPSTPPNAVSAGQIPLVSVTEEEKVWGNASALVFGALYTK